MRPPDNRKRRPRAGSGALVGADDTVMVPRLAAAGVVTAEAIAGPPAPGRRMWLVVVLHCPVCDGLHGHRALDVERLLSGEAVRRCPSTRRRYVLDVRGDTQAVAS